MRAHSILASHTFLDTAAALIARCDSDAYVLVAQPGVHASDLSAAVYLAERVAAVPAAQRWAPASVFASGAAADMGGVVEALQHAAVEKCGARIEGVDANSECGFLRGRGRVLTAGSWLVQAVRQRDAKGRAHRP